jgi:hypothetical protein
MNEHPHPDVSWGCPECKSTDINCRRQGPKYYTPRCMCMDCGVRFNSPREIEQAVGVSSNGP